MITRISRYLKQSISISNQDRKSRRSINSYIYAVLLTGNNNISSRFYHFVLILLSKLTVALLQYLPQPPEELRLHAEIDSLTSDGCRSIRCGR